MPFEKGKKKTGGRKKGIKNKLPSTVKDNYEVVFEKLGGVKGFYDWAKSSKQRQGHFYQMYSKMLPSNVDVEPGGELAVILKKVLTDKRPEE